MTVSGKLPPGGNGDKQPSQSSRPGPSQRPKAHRNKSEAPATWSWNALCGRPFDTLVGRGGYGDHDFAEKIGVTEKALCQWRKDESESAELQEAPRQARLVTLCPTDRFENRYVSLQQELGLPEIDSPEMSRSVEISRFLKGRVWVDLEIRDVWKPDAETAVRSFPHVERHPEAPRDDT